MIPTTIFLTILFAASISSASPQSCAGFLDSGDIAYRRFDNAAALDLYTRAHRLCPDNYYALMKTARALADVGGDRNDRGSAAFFYLGLRYADTLVRRYPDSAQSYFHRAVSAGYLAHLKNGREKFTLSQIVERDIKKSIELDPSFAPAYVVLGVYYREIAELGTIQRTLLRLFLGGMPAGTLEDSERALFRALERSPCNIDALLELAKTKAAMGHAGEAVSLLEKMKDCPDSWHLDGRFRKEGVQLLRRLRNR